MATNASNQIEIVVEAKDELSKKAIVNNLHFWRLSPGLPGVAKSAVLAVFIGLWQNFIDSSSLTTSYKVYKYKLRNIDDDTDAYLEVAGGVDDIGTAAPPTIPTSETVTLQAKSGLRGRSYNGSVHLWGFPDAVVEDNRLTTSAATIVGSSLVAPLMAGLTSDGKTWAWAIWSRKLSGDPVATDNQFMSPVITPKINLTMGVMKHRREKTVSV